MARPTLPQRTAASFNVPNEYTNLEIVGQGTFGTVCKATHTDKETGEETTVAIKLIEVFNWDTAYAIKVLHELEILNHFQAVDQIVCCHDAFVRASPPGEGIAPHHEDVYLVMEYMETDLGTIFNGDQISSEAQLRRIVCQLLLGLAPLHARNCIHRDLKHANILVNQGADADVRIGDFGLARFYEQGEQQSYGMATLWWRAPEIICEAAYTSKADIWAVGVMMAEMLTKQFLLPGGEQVDQLNKILDLVGPPDATWFDRGERVPPFGSDLRLPPGQGTFSSSSTNARDHVLRYIASARQRPGGLPEPDSGAFVYRLEQQFKFQLSDDGKDFLQKMLRFNPDTRMSAADALQHAWIQESNLAGIVESYLKAQENIIYSVKLTSGATGLTAENEILQILKDKFNVESNQVTFCRWCHRFKLVGDSSNVETAKTSLNQASDGDSAESESLGCTTVAAAAELPSFDFSKWEIPDPQQIGANYADEDGEPEEMRQRVNKNVCPPVAGGRQFVALNAAIHAVVNKIHSQRCPH